MPVLPGAQPFTADGSGALARTGAVVVQGPPGAGQSVRPWAAHPAGAGLAVRAPLLPGQGTRRQALDVTRRPQWYGDVERVFDDPQARCEQVSVAGLSTGGSRPSPEPTAAP